MIDKMTHLENKIQLLQKKKEKIKTQQALSFMKEAQKIFQNDFAPEVVLAALKDAWTTAPKSQKEEWKKQSYSFRQDSLQETCKNPKTTQSTDHKSRTGKIQTHE